MTTGIGSSLNALRIKEERNINSSGEGRFVKYTTIVSNYYSDGSKRVITLMSEEDEDWGTVSETGRYDAEYPPLELRHLRFDEGYKAGTLSGLCYLSCDIQGWTVNTHRGVVLGDRLPEYEQPNKTEIACAMCDRPNYPQLPDCLWGWRLEPEKAEILLNDIPVLNPKDFKKMSLQQLKNFFEENFILQPLSYPNKKTSWEESYKEEVQFRTENKVTIKNYVNHRNEWLQYLKTLYQINIPWQRKTFLNRR
ncbi:MAG: hypothetical protein NWQ43_06040 [Dolichospermum sp.]|nr:hypothetical protein [Dolichospermum sp.]